MNVRQVFSPPETPRQYARVRTHDQKHIKLQIQLDEKKASIKATAWLTLSSVAKTHRYIALDLSNDLETLEVRSEKRVLPFEHVSDRLKIDFGKRPPPIDQDFEIMIRYSGRPSRGLYFIQPDAAFPNKPYQIWSQGQDEDSKYWFPCFDHPNAKSTSEIVATVHQPFQVISNGQLLSTTENKRQRTSTFHWHEVSPHPAYLTSIVVGEFFEACDLMDGIEIRYSVPLEYKKDLKRTFRNTPKMLQYFAKVLDFPYPHHKYSQVVVYDFVFGGMENISATTLTDSIMLDATAAATTTSDWLISHELAHQWWGNLLTCKEWSHAWLNEGFATYFECIWTEHSKGREEFRWQVEGNAQSYFSEDRDRYRRPIVERRYTKPLELFDRHLYEKGALVLHMLRHELGETLFWKAMRHYVRRFQFQSVETHDLKIAIEEATGRHLDKFFDQWIFSAGYPEYSVTWSWDDESKQALIQVKQVQKTDDETPLFDVEIEIELGFSNKTTRHKIRIYESEHTLHLPCRSKPRYLRFDPDHWILKKLDLKQSREEWTAQLEFAMDSFAQIEAARALSAFVGETQVQENLARALRRAQFFATKGGLAMALATSRSDFARRVILEQLQKTTSTRTKKRLVQSLAVFKKDPAVIRALRSLWKRRDYFVRAEILTTLARVRAPKTFEFCVRALEESSHRDIIASAAVRALAEIEDSRSGDLLMKNAAYGHSRWRREAAMTSLAKWGQTHPHSGREIQDFLEDFLWDKDFYARLAAIKALALLGRSQAITALRQLARQGSDSRVQKSADEAIRRITSGEQQPEAIRTLQENMDSLVRENRGLRQRLGKLESLFATSKKRSG